MRGRLLLLATATGCMLVAIQAIASPGRYMLGENGMTVDSLSGIVVAGPWGERRAYAPLDTTTILSGFLGTWAKKPEDCAPARSLPDQATKTENGVVIIRREGIASKNGFLRLTRSYIHVSPSLTPRTIETGKAIRLSAQKFRRAREMLIFVESQNAVGQNIAVQLLLSDNGQALRIGERLPLAAWQRCTP